MDESELRALIERNPREALTRLVDALGASVWRLARHWLGADAEDGVQDAFREIARSLPRFRGESTAKTWGTRIAMNTILDHRKRRDRRARHEVAVDDVGAVGATLTDRTTRSFGENPFSAVERAERRERVRAALEALPDAYRAVLALRTYEGMRYAEIADTLGVPLGTVKSRMAAGSVLLAERLQREMDGDA